MLDDQATAMQSGSRIGTVTMYDTKIVIAGLVLFIGLATLPFWITGGTKTPMPKPLIKAGTEKCVEPVEFMRANHMILLDQWRNSVVRDDNRIYVSSSGRTFEKSLTKTCLNCHANKAQFCEQCHKAVAVEPYCWSCHLVPGQKMAPRTVLERELRENLIGKTSAPSTQGTPPPRGFSLAKNDPARAHKSVQQPSSIRDRSVGP